MPEEDEPSASASPGGRLRAALTDVQIQVLLDVVAGAGHLRAVDDRLRAADPDLADTVRRILDEPKTQSGAAPSSQKTIEIWNDLWGALGPIMSRKSAQWMKALSEVNPVSYNNVLIRWKTEFRRRRNLWADMATAGCPGL